MSRITRTSTPVSLASRAIGRYVLRIISDRWHGCEEVLPVSFKHLLLPHVSASHTKLLPLSPLPLSALAAPAYQSLYQPQRLPPLCFCNILRAFPLCVFATSYTPSPSVFL